MSIDKSDKKASQRREFEKQSGKIQGSYTEDGFYRSNKYQPAMDMSSMSQKASAYEHPHGNGMHTASDMGYGTLNPSKYAVADSTKEQEYEVLAVFELNRERQKNRILQKRLINKQVHIQKMTKVLNGLTEAYEKCQADLQYHKRKNAQSGDVREYLEEISQLKHLVIRLEDKITEYERRQSKRYNSVKQQSAPNSNDRRDISTFKAHGEDGEVVDKREKRSKTVANQQDSPQFKKLNIIEDYVVKYPNRITNFISQFMGMVECFSTEAQQIKSVPDSHTTKRRLKIGWKWIKQVVVEWNHLRNYSQKAKYFHHKLRKIFNIPDSAEDQEIMDIILHAID